MIRRFVKGETYKMRTIGGVNLTRVISLPVALAVLLVSLIYLWMNRHQYPVFDGDSGSFLPVAISYARGEGLVNLIWHPFYVYDTRYPGNFTWHGFLYPMLLGSLAPSPTYKAIRLIIGVLWL